MENSGSLFKNKVFCLIASLFIISVSQLLASSLPKSKIENKKLVETVSEKIVATGKTITYTLPGKQTCEADGPMFKIPGIDFYAVSVNCKIPNVGVITRLVLSKNNHVIKVGNPVTFRVVLYSIKTLINESGRFFIYDESNASEIVPALSKEAK